MATQTKSPVGHCAIAAGATAEEILALLDRHSRNPVPQNVHFSIREWADRIRFVTCERLVETNDLLKGGSAHTLKINRSMVDGVIEAPGGAHFTECPPDYGRDEAFQQKMRELRDAYGVPSDGAGSPS